MDDEIGLWNPDYKPKGITPIQEKTAVVTWCMKSKIEESMIAWVWLLDVHKTAVYKYSSESLLKDGDFIKGLFQETYGYWTCKKLLGTVPPVLDRKEDGQYCELRVFIENWELLGPKLYANAFHPLIGPIVDKEKNLPWENKKLEIAIRFRAKRSRSKIKPKQFEWVVVKCFYDRHRKLLIAFSRIWHSSIVANQIAALCSNETFSALFNLYKIERLSLDDRFNLRHLEAKLQKMSFDEVHSLYEVVRSVLRNNDVQSLLKKQQISMSDIRRYS